MNAFEYGFFDELEKLATRIDPSFRERELAWKPKDRSRRDFGDMLTRESRRNYDERGFTPEAKAIRTVRQAARSAPEYTGRISERMPIPEPQISAPSPAAASPAASPAAPIPQVGQRRRERLAQGLRRVQRPQKSAPSAVEKLQANSSQGASPYLPVPASNSTPATPPAPAGGQAPQMPNSRWGGAPNPNPNPMPAQPAAPSMASASTVPPVVPQAAPAQNPGWSTNKKLLAGGLGVAGAYGLYRMLNSNRDKEREKTAASNKPAPAKQTQYPFNMSGKTFRSIGLGLAATPLVAMGAGKLMSLHAVHKNKQFLKDKNPNGVASHPLFEQQFNSLKRFSPKVAADPLAATHALHKMQHSSQNLLDILKDVHQLHTEDAERRLESRGLVGETGERLLGGMG